MPDRPEDRAAAAAALPEDPEDLGAESAAERTRLAWTRTAIGFGAVGLAMLRREPVEGLLVLALPPLIWSLGRYVGGARPEARSRRLALITVAVTGVAILAAVAAFLGHGGPPFRFR